MSRGYRRRGRRWLLAVVVVVVVVVLARVLPVLLPIGAAAAVGYAVGFRRRPVARGTRPVPAPRPSPKADARVREADARTDQYRAELARLRDLVDALEDVTGRDIEDVIASYRHTQRLYGPMASGRRQWLLTPHSRTRAS